MNQLIFSDADARPDLFVWNRAIETAVLNKWMFEHHIQNIPQDLSAFWQKTGGGDIFETETILGPLGNSQFGDDILEVNRQLRKQGMPDDYFVFHQGLGGLSAVRITDSHYVQISEDDFSEIAEYATFEEWYQMIRDEYADRYQGLMTSLHICAA